MAQLNVHKRLESLEQADKGMIHVIRVGFDGTNYFPETKEAALLRYGITPNREDTLIYVTYTAE